MHRLKTEMAAKHKITPCLLQRVWVRIKPKRALEGKHEQGAEAGTNPLPLLTPSQS